MSEICMQRFVIQCPEDEIEERFEEKMEEIDGEIISVNMNEKIVETESGTLETKITYSVIYVDYTEDDYNVNDEDNEDETEDEFGMEDNLPL